MPVFGSVYVLTAIYYVLTLLYLKAAAVTFTVLEYYLFLTLISVRGTSFHQFLIWNKYIA